MALTLQQRVEDYLGSTIADTGALSQFLADAAREVIDVLPYERLKRSATVLALSAEGKAAITMKKVLPNGVTVNSHVAREIPYSRVGDASTAGSLHYSAALTDPAYYFSDGSLIVCNWDTGMTGSVLLVPYPTPLYSETAISGIPMEAEELAVMGAALRCLTQLLDNERAALDALHATLEAGIPTPPMLTATAPTDLPTAPASAPAAIAAISVSTHLDQIHTFINTNEDVELAQAEVQEVTARVQEYQEKVQVYQADIAKYGVEVQKFAAATGLFGQEVGVYTAEIQAYAAKVQSYAAQLSGVIQEYSLKRDLRLASINALSAVLGTLRTQYYDSLKFLTGASLAGGGQKQG